MPSSRTSTAFLMTYIVACTSRPGSGRPLHGATVIHRRTYPSLSFKYGQWETSTFTVPQSGFQYEVRILKGKDKVVPLLNWAPRHADVW
jgi:hypothetical protein